MAATAGATWPRCASATTTTREAGRGTAPKLGIAEKRRKRLSYLTFRWLRRMLPRRDQLDNPARELLRDRPDGRGVPRQLLDLVRPRAHRADARDGADLQRARAAGRLPRRLRSPHALPRRRPLRRSGAGALLGARARVPAGHLRLRGRAGGDGRAARHRRDLARLPHPSTHSDAYPAACPRP